MKALIDADILLYEIGFSSQETVGGEILPRSWEFCQDLLDKKISLICDETKSDEYILFLNNSQFISKYLNKQRERAGEDKVVYLENFREKAATTRTYKGNRSKVKPFHYKNLVIHILSSHPYHVAENGIEADDAMCIYQMKSPPLTTVICSRDKDLKQCPGLHYSWEIANQPAKGPFEVSEFGRLTKEIRQRKTKKGEIINETKYYGDGKKFFYFQMLTGDTTDNIIGVMGRGSAFAYNLLNDASTERECYELAAEVYVKFFGDEWEEKWKEMSDLLYMIKELNENGEPVKWQKPILELASV